jgi:hypothetical protein
MVVVRHSLKQDEKTAVLRQASVTRADGQALLQRRLG